MKRYFTSASMVSVGILGLCSVGAQDKPWNLTGTVRGFYDDNYATLPTTPVPGGAAKDDSFGVEVNPALTWNTGSGPTTVALTYDYRLRFFEGRPNNQTDNQHVGRVRVKNQFADRYTLSVDNRFAHAQEPDVAGGVIGAPVKSQGTYLNNNATIKLGAELTELAGLELGYNNVFFDYQQDGVGSRSALLDRVEHYLELNSRWNLQPTLVGIIGYRFGYLDQTSKDDIANLGSGAPRTVVPNERDAVTHFAYLGADKRFTEVLSGSVRGGLQYTTYPNAVAGATDSTINPFVDASASYSFSDSGRVQLGVKHALNATDIAFTGGVNPTLDAETTTVYGSLSSRLVGDLSGSLVGQYQYSTFNDGAANGSVDHLIALGATLSYDILPGGRLQAETGYSFDRLDSDQGGRSFSRNRVFLGLRASY